MLDRGSVNLGQIRARMIVGIGVQTRLQFADALKQALSQIHEIGADQFVADLNASWVSNVP